MDMRYKRLFIVGSVVLCGRKIDSSQPKLFIPEFTELSEARQLAELIWYALWRANSLRAKIYSHEIPD